MEIDWTPDQSYEAIVELYSNTVYRLAYAIVRSKADADALHLHDILAKIIAVVLVMI